MVVACVPVKSVFDSTSPIISLSTTLKHRIRVAKAVMTHQINIIQMTEFPMFLYFNFLRHKLLYYFSKARQNPSYMLMVWTDIQKHLQSTLFSQFDISMLSIVCM